MSIGFFVVGGDWGIGRGKYHNLTHKFELPVAEGSAEKIEFSDFEFYDVWTDENGEFRSNAKDVSIDDIVDERVFSTIRTLVFTPDEERIHALKLLRHSDDRLASVWLKASHWTEIQTIQLHLTLEMSKKS